MCPSRTEDLLSGNGARCVLACCWRRLALSTDCPRAVTGSTGGLCKSTSAVTGPRRPLPRWWEGPALEILGTSSNVDLLIAICDFDLFQDPMASARALSRQPSARLDAILSVLRGGTVVLDNGLNRVQQILATLRNKDALSWDPAWFFHSLASSDSVEAIAERLHSSIWSAFCSVTYASWVRWVLGYGIAGVSNFFAALSNFRSEVIQCRQIPRC